MKVVVIGANGQLGTDVVDEFCRNGDEALGLTHDQLDIRSLESVSSVLEAARPAVIVNTAAMHHVENCEREPLEAYAVNSIGARNLAIVGDRLGAVLIHVSTDYVFDGAKMQPYLESDLALPLNVYGNTKLAGEAFIRATTRRYCILRTSALFGTHPCRAKAGRNFVELMLKLAAEREEVRVVNDEFVSPTFTKDLAAQIVLLSRSDRFALYHATAESSCSWYEFAKAIFTMTKTRANLQIASSNEFPAKVARPKYAVLENYELKKNGLNSFRNWEDGLHSYLHSAGYLNGNEFLDNKNKRLGRLQI
jgi:dTDP-4-dehydrorhamnose reductase